MKKGCLISLVIVVGVPCIILVLVIFVGIVSNWGTKGQSPVVEYRATVDSAMIKYNDSLSKERVKTLDIEIGKIKNKFTTKYDDIEGVTWIYHKNKPYYANNKAFYIYLGLSDKGNVWQRLVIRYHGDDWLFIEKITIKTDNNTYTIDASNSERDHNADVWEWIDIAPTSVEDIIVSNIIESKSTKVRFSGKQYSQDWVLTSKEVKGLKEIKEYYALLEEKYMLTK